MTVISTTIVKSMYATVIHQYGAPDVFDYRLVDAPAIKPDQVLIRVFASSVNPIDWKVRKGMLKLLPGQQFPLILGFDVAGEIIKVGDQVSRFQVGDAVYAYSDQFPGGAYAEYIAVSENVTAPKPYNQSYPEAAAVPLAATTALQALRDCGMLKAGQRVLINGASGGVGIFAVQLAKVFGAEVTAVCGPQNIELMQNLGSDRVIDYKQINFTQEAATYDLIFDVVGSKPFSDCKKVLKPSGIYVSTQPAPGNFVQALISSVLPGQTAKVIIARANAGDLLYLKEQIESGKVRSIVDHTYPLTEIAEAHRYSEEGHAVGKIEAEPKN
jgi:2-desacetyl-2-hydroxyethyl bacteriochlorophyllide A dehydrogenase